jgi:hypothetical protein
MGVRVTHKVDEAIRDADIINLLRIQHERQRKAMFPSLNEYSSLFGLNQARLALTRPDALIMHPGPINRGIEIDSSVADCDRSLILEQVTNGLAVRMAVLFLVNGGKGPQEISPPQLIVILIGDARFIAGCGYVGMAAKTGQPGSPGFGLRRSWAGVAQLQLRGFGPRGRYHRARDAGGVARGHIPLVHCASSSGVV